VFILIIAETPVEYPMQWGAAVPGRRGGRPPPARTARQVPPRPWGNRSCTARDGCLRDGTVGPERRLVRSAAATAALRASARQGFRAGRERPQGGGARRPFPQGGGPWRGRTCGRRSPGPPPSWL
jgi:hypothetical protein